MNIQEAKEQIEKAVRIYLMKDEYGDYRDHDRSQKGHQGVSAADGCQCAGTKKTSDDNRIGNIVDLL